MTTRATPTLASPLRLPCGLELPNRLAKAAMTEGLAGRDHLPSERLERLYGRWAEAGGLGLVITGNVGLDADHTVRPGDVVLRDGAPLEPFARWATTARRGGARVVMQLNHAGRQTPKMTNPQPVGPSEGPAVATLRAFGRPRAATEAEIAEVIRRHGEAAAAAERAGFDGVQVHAAHGYLLNQFLAPDVNVRTDGWGGDVRGRARLLLACVRAARAATSPGFAVLVKLNAGDFLKGGLTEDDALEVVGLLDAEGVDLLEVSGGRYESGASFGHATPAAGPREAYFARFAGRARQATRAPVLLTGGLRTRGAMEASLADGALDVVGLARPLVVDPGYARRLLEGAPLPTTSAPRLGLASLEGAAELAWYYARLARLADGASGSPSAARALAELLLGDAWRAFVTRWRARGAKAPAGAQASGTSAASAGGSGDVASKASVASLPPS